MDQETNGPAEGNRVEGAPEQAGGGGGVGGGGAGNGVLHPDPIRGAEQAGGTQRGGPGNNGGGHEDSQESGDGQGEDAAKAGRAEIRRHTGPREAITAERVAAALKVAYANGGKYGAPGRAGLILDRSADWVKDRIHGNKQLKAMWGQLAVSAAEGEGSVVGRVAPGGATALMRSGAAISGTPPSDADLTEMVSQADKQLHELGLKNLGVSEKTLKRLKGLDDLARNSGQFIAISLEKTQRLYYLQVIELMECAQEVRNRLLAPFGSEEYIASDEARAFFNRSYVEMVRETGRAYELMLTGATAMVKMIQAAKGGEQGDGQGKRKPGWGTTPRKVLPADPNDHHAEN